MSTHRAENAPRVEVPLTLQAVVSIPRPASSVVAAYVKRGDGCVGTRISTSA